MAKGKCIGAIIKNEKGEFLAQYRLKIPTGLAMPAGHIEDGEIPEDCLTREILEETGLIIKSYKPLIENKYYPNPCPKSHEGHDWWVYEVVAEGEPILKEPDKHKFLRFMPLKEIREYIKRGETDPAWFKYILPELGII